MFDNCTTAQCCELLAMLALSIVVGAGLMATVIALFAGWLERGIREVERAEQAFWPEDHTR